MTYYAVNLADLTKPEHIIMSNLLISPVRGPIVDAEPGQWSGAAIRLDCDEGRAKAIVELIRQRERKHHLRCYESRDGNSWKQI